MKNKEQHNEIENIEIKNPPILTEEISHVFEIASKFSLTAEEKLKGENEFRTLLEKGLPVVSVPSPYSQYIISAQKFFEGFSKQFNSHKIYDFALINKKKLFQIVLTACFIFVCATGTTYAANMSLPGDLLYPIKIGLNEPLESIFSISSEAKAQVAVRHAVERVKEVSKLSMMDKINQNNEIKLSEAIAKKSGEARESIIKLESTGHLSAANNISANFENSVNIYKKDIETVSRFNSESGHGDTLQNVLNTLNGEIQKISKPQNKQNETIDTNTERSEYNKKNPRYRNDKKYKQDRTSDYEHANINNQNGVNLLIPRKEATTSAQPVYTGALPATSTEEKSSATEIQVLTPEHVQIPSTSAASQISVPSTPVPDVSIQVQVPVSIPSVVTPTVQINIK
ncbi:MAG: hypothetical protein K9M11_02985 [Candidatus Pacebacteria bacterium]|nr:hypothetical protein [Candidatus Paceibacterota bacterium]